MVHPPPRGPQAMSDDERRPFWQVHFATYVLTAVIATGSYALDIPNALLRSRPLSFGPTTNLIFTIVLAVMATTVIELLMRQGKRRQRRPFQFRLSSAVFTILLLGGLLYLNVLPYETDFSSFDEQRGEQIYEVWGKVSLYGWPMRAYRRFSKTIVYNAGKPDASFEPKQSYFESWNPQFNGASLMFNITFSFAFVYAFLCACEWLLRRREGRKP
jgi:hypothetical protein